MKGGPNLVFNSVQKTCLFDLLHHLLPPYHLTHHEILTLDNAKVWNPELRSFFVRTDRSTDCAFFTPSG